MGLFPDLFGPLSEKSAFDLATEAWIYDEMTKDDDELDVDELDDLWKDDDLELEDDLEGYD